MKMRPGAPESKLAGTYKKNKHAGRGRGLGQMCMQEGRVKNSVRGPHKVGLRGRVGKGVKWSMRLWVS